MLHTAVLEPDFNLKLKIAINIQDFSSIKSITYLSLSQVQARRNFNPSWTTQVLVEVKLLFQLEQLCVGVRGPQAPW